MEARRRTRRGLHNNKNAAAELYPWMDHELQQAFYICYQNYGKISTKKLVACLGHSDITQALVALTNGKFMIPKLVHDDDYDGGDGDDETITEEDSFVKIDKNDILLSKQQEHDGRKEEEIINKCPPHWLETMAIGPGVSPCVNVTCQCVLASSIINYEDSNSSIDRCSFYRALCEHVSEIKKYVRKYKIDLDEVFCDVYKVEG